jgi:hypothetical protein
VNDGEETPGRTEADRGIPPFIVSTCVLQNKKRIVKDGDCLLEGDSMLVNIELGLRLVPYEAGTTMFEMPFHGRIILRFCIYKVNTPAYSAWRPGFVSPVKAGDIEAWAKLTREGFGVMLLCSRKSLILFDMRADGIEPPTFAV